MFINPKFPAFNSDASIYFYLTKRVSGSQSKQAVKSDESI